jgi:hypothetical protein
MAIPFLNVLKNFANSEKAIAVGVFAIIATVFVFVDRITVQEWMGYTEILLGIYVGGKAVQGAASAVSGSKAAKADAATAKVELAKLKTAIATNDDAANAALKAKFAGEANGETD